VVHLSTSYIIIRDELDRSECIPYAQNKNCYETAQKCVQGPETREIANKKIFKECWKYEKEYSCLGSSKISTCHNFSDSCELLKKVCLSEDNQGQCNHYEFKYECNNSIKNSKGTNECNPDKFCVGDKCQEFGEISYEKNQNMNKAISALAILKSAGTDNGLKDCLNGNSEQCPIFSGKSYNCRKSIANARNCCLEKGWALDMKLADCNDREVELAKKQEAHSCHYIGVYCAKKASGMCIDKKRTYCCFNSKLSRIIHEQGRQQLNISWGTAKVPNCRALTIEELKKIDFNKIDFSEYFNDIKVNLSKTYQDINPNTLKSPEINRSVSSAKYSRIIEDKVSKHFSNLGMEGK